MQFFLRSLHKLRTGTRAIAPTLSSKVLLDFKFYLEIKIPTMPGYSGSVAEGWGLARDIKRRDELNLVT